MKNSKALLLGVHGLGGASTLESLPEGASLVRFIYEPGSLIEPNGVQKLAKEFLNFALDRMEDDHQPPIVCLACDLGGLILKKALVLANLGGSTQRKLLGSITTLVFFGTPHQETPTETWEKTTLCLLNLLWQPKSDISERLHEIIPILSIEQRRVSGEFSTLCGRFRVIQYAQGTASPNVIIEPPNVRLGCAYEEILYFIVDFERLTKLKGKMHRNKYLDISREAMSLASPQYRSLVVTLELLGSRAVYMAPKDIYFGETASTLTAQDPIQKWLSPDAKHPMALQIPQSFQNDDFILSIAASVSELRHEGLEKFLVLTINLAQPVRNFHGSPAVSFLSDLLHQALQRHPLFWQDVLKTISYDDLVAALSGFASSLLESVLWSCFMTLLATKRSIVCVMALGSADSDRLSWEPVLQRLVAVATGVDCDFKLMILYSDRSPARDIGPAVELELDVDDSRLRESIMLDATRLGSTTGGPRLAELQKHISPAVSDAFGESLRLAAFMRYIRTPGTFPEQQLASGLELLSKQVEPLLAVLKHVPDPSKDYVRGILFIVTYSLRPLDISELEDGLGILMLQAATPLSSQQHGVNYYLTTFLLPLLRIDHDMVRLIHPDIRHHLDQSHVHWYFPLAQPQLRMAKLCVNCIASTLTPGDAEEQLDSDAMMIDDREDDIVSHTAGHRSFLNYAVLNWPFHFMNGLLADTDEASVQEVVALLSDKLLIQWLKQYVVVRHPAKHSSLTPSLKMSPLKLGEECELELHCALRVCLQALDSFAALGGKEDVAIALSITKVIGVEAGAKYWRTNVHQDSKDPSQILQSFGLDPSKAFQLLVAIDEDYVRSHLSDLISHDIRFGGHSVLDYIYAQSPAGDGSLFQARNWCVGGSPLTALSMKMTVGLLSTDDSTRNTRTSLMSIGMADFLLAAEKRLQTLLDSADPEFALTALYAAVSGGFGSIAETIVRLKLGLDDEARLHAIALATECGFIEVLNQLLSHTNPEYINRPIDGTHTILHLATGKGFVRLVTILLDHGARVDVTDPSGTTPFLQAVEYGNLPIAQRLWEQARQCQEGAHDADEEEADSFTVTDRPNDQGLSPLLSSLRNGFKSIAEALLEEDARLDGKDINDNNPAHLASEAGFSDLLERILKRNRTMIEQRNEDGYTPLEVAVRNGHAKCVSCLIRNRLYGDLTEPLRIALKENYPEVFEVLLDHDNSEEALGESLHYAAIYGRPKMCHRLLDLGADKNYRDTPGNTALALAAYHGRRTCIEILLLRKAKVDDKDALGRTALWEAVRNGNRENCKLLVDAGADVLAEDNDGRSPLDLIEPNNLHLFSLLWKSWVATLDPDERKTQMKERLEHAISHGYSDLVGQILSEGVQSCSEHLGMAIERRHAAIVSLLIKHGVKLNSVTMERSDVPIRYAASYCDLELARVLFEEGEANVNQTGGRPWSALYACLASGEAYEKKRAMLDKLIKYGANVTDTSGPRGSVLHYALARDPMLAQYLIEKYDTMIDLGKGDIEGRKPAHAAALRNNTIVLRKALNHSSENSDCQRRLPIHFAAAGGSLNALEQIMKLSEQGADLLFKTDIDGWNSLHWACRQEDSFVAEWILNQAGDRKSSLILSKTIEPQGWSAHDVAIAHGNEHILKTLSEEKDLFRPRVSWHPVTADCDSCFCTIYGQRHKCLQCDDYDLCFKCVKHAEDFHKGHEFREP